jgi:serine/threonine protein kinase/WD40 repeat protein/Flp pilus assembly protein TadD
VTEYVERHPELALKIREVFPALLAIEGASPRAGPVGSPGHISSRGDGPVPERLGDFRINREIGRGGMGVVYEAVQESLGREVALKVLPLGALADPAALKRFRREARSVAALHHSNIVPVFGIGEHAGHHFYAMQLIHGQTLEAVLAGVRRLRDIASPGPAATLSWDQRAATVIAGRLIDGGFAEATSRISSDEKTRDTTESIAPSEAVDRAPAAPGDPSVTAVTSVSFAELGASHYHRRIARIGLQVAEAIAYAHDQGVLHRDIKPSNLLMDHLGTVWVLDFGLAKAEAVGEHSASRDIVGTLRYMAPERFDGRSDRRSDVYGLGVTLYELLTLEPAFKATQQSALIHQVLHSVPTQPRKIDRRIPRDLETIVQKAMSKDPPARYVSAHALGEDLRRFLENRTILARRSSAFARTGRWCRRNPAVAALLGSVLALLAFIAGYSSLSATRYRHQFERASAAEIDGREKLYSSYVAQARASRFSRRPGQRFGALRALTAAATIHTRPELRDEAIAALALPDVDEIHRSPKPFSGVTLVYDRSLKRYARLEWDGVLSVRQVNDDREVRRFESPGPVAENYLIEFSPDGRYLAVIYRLATSHPLKVWRLDRDEPVLVVDGSDTLFGSRFTPDGATIAIVYTGGSIVFHNLDSGRSLPPSHFGAEIQHLTFSRDARMAAVILATNPRKITICALPSGEVLREMSVPGLCTITWDPNGSTLAAACEDARIYLYDTLTGRQTGVLADHTSMGIFTVFQPTGSLLASNGWDGKLRIWRPETGEMLLALAAGGEMAFGPDGSRFGALTSDGSPVQFQVAQGCEYRSFVRSPVRRRDKALCSALHPSGRLLAVGNTSGVCFWDINRDVSIAWLPIGLTQAVAFEPSGGLLTLGRTGLARWPVQTGPSDSNSFRVGPPDLLSKYKGGRMALSRDGRLLGVCYDFQNPVVLDLEHPGTPIHLGPQADVRYITLSAEGRWAATGSHNTRDGLKIWSLPDGRLEKHFANSGLYAAARFSPDGRSLAVNLGNEVTLRTVGDWKERFRLNGGAIEFSPDGRLLALSRPDKTVLLVDSETGRHIASLDDPQQLRANQATFSPDGSQLILCGEDRRAANLWDLRAIRRELAAMRLDWDWPALPEPDIAKIAAGTLAVSTDLGGNDFSWGPSEPQELDRLNEALEIDPTDLYAIVRRGRIHMNNGNHDQALTDYTRACAIKPGDPIIRGGRGEACLWKKDYALGFADCEASLTAIPDQANLQNHVAWAYAMAQPPFRDAANAITHARKAVQLAPAIGTHHNTLGVALYRGGEYSEAVTELEASLATASEADAPYDLFFLAMCRAALSDTDRAKADFEGGCRLQAAHPVVAAQLEELQSIRREAEAVLAKLYFP